MAHEPSDDLIAIARGNWIENGWPDAAEGMALVTSIVRVQQLLMARIESVLRPHHLSFARYELLMLLAFSRNGALPMSRIGSRLQVHPTSVTSAVDKLEASELVIRKRSEADRRTVLATLTPAGRDLAQRATTDLNREVFSDLGLTSPQQTSALHVMRQLRTAWGDPEDPSSEFHTDPPSSRPGARPS